MDSFELLPLPPEYAIDTGTAAVARRRDTVEVPVFWIVLLLSVLVHVAVLYFVPPLRLAVRPGLDPDAPLAVELRPLPPAKAPESAAPAPRPKSIPPVAVAPRPAPPRPAPPPPRATPPAPPPAAVPRPAPPAPSTPPVITQPAPEPQSPIARAEPPPPIARAEPAAPERVQKPPAGDLSSYIEARRRARGELPSTPAPASVAPAPADDEEARRNRIVARNLGLDRAPTFGGPPKQGGGIFQVTSLHYGYAEFLFFGWNKDIRRNTTQLIEVRKGEHSDIKLAVIRRMIAIIREHESGDFLWESPRLGRDVMLSARPADNAGLEEFLMREFFGEPRPAIGATGRAPG